MPRKRRDFFRGYQRKRFGARHWQNPYFERQKKQHKRWPYLLAILIAGLLIYLIFYNPWFRIDHVNVEGTKYIDTSLVESEISSYLDKNRWLVLPGNNRWIFSEDRLTEHLVKKFVFESTEIKLKKKTLSVTVTERVSKMIWATSEQQYLIDLAGTIIRTITPEEQETYADLPKIHDLENKPVSLGQTVMSDSVVQGTIGFFGLAAQGGIVIEYFYAESNDDNWLIAKTDQDYKIYFIPIEDIEAQANNLVIILRESIDNPNAIQYIDLRFGDHVYYK